MDNTPDIIYLDIVMPEMLGTEVAAKIRSLGLMCEIIFLTSTAKYVFSAFDVDATNYIVKNEMDDNKFEQIFIKTVAKVKKKQQEIITFSRAGEVRAIPVSEIHYFEVRNYIVTVYYTDDSFEFYSTLGKIEDTLLNRGFIRVHKSFLVSKLYIRKVSRQTIILADGKTIPVGRSYWNAVKKEMEISK